MGHFGEPVGLGVGFSSCLGDFGYLGLFGVWIGLFVGFCRWVGHLGYPVWLG